MTAEVELKKPRKRKSPSSSETDKKVKKLSCDKKSSKTKSGSEPMSLQSMKSFFGDVASEFALINAANNPAASLFMGPKAIVSTKRRNSMSPIVDVSELRANVETVVKFYDSNNKYENKEVFKNAWEAFARMLSCVNKKVIRAAVDFFDKPFAEKVLLVLLDSKFNSYQTLAAADPSARIGWMYAILTRFPDIPHRCKEKFQSLESELSQLLSTQNSILALYSRIGAILPSSSISL